MDCVPTIYTEGLDIFNRKFPAPPAARARALDAYQLS